MRSPRAVEIRPGPRDSPEVQRALQAFARAYLEVAGETGHDVGDPERSPNGSDTWVFCSDPDVPVDRLGDPRRHVPFEARALEFWSAPRPAQPDAVRLGSDVRIPIVAVLGAESVGKSTLAQRLARRHGGLWAPEYVRTVLERTPRRGTREDAPFIARGVRALHRSLAGLGAPLLVLDTDLLTTRVWCEVLFGSAPSPAHAPELPILLTVVLDADGAPWVADAQRTQRHAEQRRAFQRRLVHALHQARRTHTVVGGALSTRTARVLELVDDLLQRE